MVISPEKIYVGKSPELGWYIKGGNITVWCNSLQEALAHVI